MKEISKKNSNNKISEVQMLIPTKEVKRVDSVVKTKSQALKLIKECLLNTSTSDSCTSSAYDQKEKQSDSIQTKMKKDVVSLLVLHL